MYDPLKRMRADREFIARNYPRYVGMCDMRQRISALNTLKAIRAELDKLIEILEETEEKDRKVIAEAWVG